MKKIRNSFITFLCIIALSFHSIIEVYAINKPTEEKQYSKKVVFLTDGQGNINSGDGSENSPYLNINTALNNVDAGGTIKIIGKINYSKYEEHPSLLPRPLIINKEVIFEGVNNNSVFMTRAPIQLGKDVTFKNIRMEFWASNELMPGVPDPGLPQNPIDEGINFRSGRSIYLAGNKLTLDNVDTRINTLSFQRDYRPYISGGTFIDEGTIGPKAILNVINPNEGTEFAGIYAGDYWKERAYPVELNINGKVIDNTIHTGGIINSFNGDVIVNVYNKGKFSIINTKNHNGNTDVSLKENTWLQNIDFNGIRNLTLENNSQATFKKGTKFNVDNITLKKKALLDLRNINGNSIINGDFNGDINTPSNNDTLGGVIFLKSNQMLDIKGDVKGITRLNSYSNINKVPLEENHTYIKAKENATGDFEIAPDFAQSDYKLEKNLNNSLRTTWTTIRKKTIFKEFRWNGNLNDNIINPEENKDYIYPIEFIDENNNNYIPFGEDWNDFSITLRKPDGTILDENSDDFDLGVFLDLTGVVINIYDTSFSGKLTLTVTHKSGQTITKNIQIGKKTNSNPPIINGANDIEIKVGDVDKFNNNLLKGITVSDDNDIIDPSSIKVTGQVGKPSPGTNEEYRLTYEVKDSDENITVVSRIVTVTNQLPKINGLNEISINKGQTTDLKTGVMASDYEDGDLTEDIIYPKIDLSKLEVGRHEIEYKVTDSDRNLVTITRKVIVKAGQVETIKATSSAMKAYFNTKGDLYINATFTEKNLGLATLKKYAKLIDSTTGKEVEGIKVTTQNFKEPEFNKFQIGIRKEMLDKLADGSYKLVLNAEVNGKKYEATLGTIPNINVSTPMEDKTISVDAIKGQDLVVSKAPLQIKESNVVIKNTYFNKSSNNFIVDGTFDIDVTADKQFAKTAVIIDVDTNQPVDGIAPIKLGNFADIKFSKFQLIVPTSVLAQLEDGTYKIKVSGFTNKTQYEGVIKSTKQYNFQNDKAVNGKRISVTTLEDGTIQFSKGNIN